MVLSQPRKLNYFHSCNTETKLEHNPEALIWTPSGCCPHSFFKLAKFVEDYRNTKLCRKAHEVFASLLPLQKKEVNLQLCFALTSRYSLHLSVSDGMDFTFCEVKISLISLIADFCKAVQCHRVPL